MNWLRLLEIIEMAFVRTGREPKRDRGWSWVCYCPVCCAIRAERDVLNLLAATPSEPEPPALDRLRHDVESLRATAHEQMTTGGALASAAFFEGAVVAYDEVLRRLATPASEEAPE